MLLKQVWPHEGSAVKAVVFELDVEVVGLYVFHSAAAVEEARWFVAGPQALTFDTRVTA